MVVDVAVLGYIPSPPGSDLGLGPVKLHIYGALIVAGVIAAVWLADRRWRARGGEQGTFSAIAMWAVPGGLVGARLYHVITDYELYTHRPLDAFKIWQGGLGIWGGIAGGVLAGWVYIRRQHLDFPAILDCVAPALPLAQAIGRWGNYFNQELFGRPTTLPWGLKVDAAHLPAAFPHAVAFHPTFLYESLWDLVVVALVLMAEKRVRLRKGYLFAVYVALYTFGRFFTEYLRIDLAHKIFGLRLNDWTSIIIFVVATTLVLTKGRARGQAAAGREHAPVAVPAAVGAAETGSTLATTDLPDEILPPATEDESDVSAFSIARAEPPAVATPPVAEPSAVGDPKPAEPVPGEATLKRAEPEAAKPGLFVKPELSADKPVPEADKPVPEADKPAPEADKPAPEADKPAPEAANPAPEAANPAPEADKPAPEADKPELTADESGHETAKPETIAAKPEPPAGGGEPEVARAKPDPTGAGEAG